MEENTNSKWVKNYDFIRSSFPDSIFKICNAEKEFSYKWQNGVLTSKFLI